MNDLENLFAEHFRTERAIDAVWRKAARSEEPIIRVGDLIDAVLARSPNADRKYVADELCSRFTRYRPRRRRAGGAP